MHDADSYSSNAHFKKSFFSPLGVPVKVTNEKEGKSKDSPLEIFSYLNEIG